MTWAGRFRLLAGVVIALVLVSALTLVLARRDGALVSTNASIQEADYIVGSDFGGTVTEVFVGAGDDVAAGEELVTLQSSELVAEESSLSDTLAYRVGEEGSLTLLATADGRVKELGVALGGFAAAGTALVTVAQPETKYVTADFLVSARDFPRIQVGSDARIRLASGDELTGQVESFDVQTDAGTTVALVRIGSERLRMETGLSVASVGAPVTATMSLAEEGILDQVDALFTDLLVRLGL